MNAAKIKENIRQELFQKLAEINGVVSVTLVGSFVNQKDLVGISDIDTIVICKSLDKKLFDACLNAVESINLKQCGLRNYALKTNPAFGPLKFDKPNLAVIHLMVYDINAHKRHVIASPFTCFDWERSETGIGPSLKEVFPVGILQFRDFMEVRRSLENYIYDLGNKVITYREYVFNGGEVVEIMKYKPLDERHRGEYAYHIVRNLIANYLKLCNKNNDSYSNQEIKAEIKRLFPETGNTHAKKFDSIYTIKSQRAYNFPENTVKWARGFLNEFQQNISGEWRDAVPIHFIRHYKTNLNNGTYLGQRRDPGIDKSITSYPKHESASMVYSSPMRRCLETTEYIWKDKEIVTDDRLLEFDYGKAEGLSYEQLLSHYPELPTGWENGEDPKFPNGENTRGVFNRLNSFLDDLEIFSDNNESDPIFIVTHNGVLRCLLGKAFGLDLNQWYKLVIPHGIPLEFLYFHNRFYPNIHRDLWADILKKIGYVVS